MSVEYKVQREISFASFYLVSEVQNKLFMSFHPFTNVIKWLLCTVFDHESEIYFNYE